VGTIPESIFDGNAVLTMWDAVEVGQGINLGEEIRSHIIRNRHNWNHRYNIVLIKTIRNYRR
jgi:hypothetical protein